MGNTKTAPRQSPMTSDACRVTAAIAPAITARLKLADEYEGSAEAHVSSWAPVKRKEWDLR